MAYGIWYMTEDVNSTGNYPFSDSNMGEFESGVQGLQDEGYKPLPLVVVPVMNEGTTVQFIFFQPMYKDEPMGEGGKE